MEFWFNDIRAEDTITLRLPITPSSISIPKGSGIETINVHAIGDVNLFGNSKLSTIKIASFFPAKDYPFKLSDTIVAVSPYDYVNLFIQWINYKTIIRFVVTETPVNMPVMIENIEYTEKDGSRDVYFNITLREYRKLEVIEESNSPVIQRTVETPYAPGTKHKVQDGDTLYFIAKKYYGDGEKLNKIVAANDIKNSNMIFAGQVLQIP
jgi:hypothetical protein